MNCSNCEVLELAGTLRIICFFHLILHNGVGDTASQCFLKIPDLKIPRQVLQASLQGGDEAGVQRAWMVCPRSHSWLVIELRVWIQILYHSVSSSVASYSLGEFHILVYFRIHIGFPLKQLKKCWLNSKGRQFVDFCMSHRLPPRTTK